MPTNENLGEWNVFVCEGKTKDERKARLLIAPERLRDDIVKHVTTVFNMRKAALDELVEQAQEMGMYDK